MYKCIKYGGSVNGYYFRYVDSDLILTKTKRKEYIKPKVNKTSKNVYYKKNINSNEEIKFDNVKEASEKTGFNANVIRRKCINNNMYEDIFRYGDKDYTFNVKIGNNKKHGYGQLLSVPVFVCATLKRSRVGRVLLRSSRPGSRRVSRPN